MLALTKWYWTVPIFSSLVWLAMLLALLLDWIVGGRTVYPSMSNGQTIAYISDVGADRLKPLFIAMSAVTVVTFDLSFIFERWLRHKGILAPNTSMGQKILNILATICAIAGAAGIILLAIFDTRRYNRLHNIFLAVFIIGYVLCAIFICAEYQRLGIRHRDQRLLRISFWLKLTFIFVEVGLAIAFGVLGRRRNYNEAAIVEWVIALIYTFFVASFFLDFVPAVKGKHHQSWEDQHDVAQQRANGRQGTGLEMQQDEMGSAPTGRFYGGGVNGGTPISGAYANGAPNGNYINGEYVNGRNGYVNGHANGNGLINGVNYK